MGLGGALGGGFCRLTCEFLFFGGGATLLTPPAPRPAGGAPTRLIAVAAAEGTEPREYDDEDLGGGAGADGGRGRRGI